MPNRDAKDKKRKRRLLNQKFAEEGRTKRQRKSKKEKRQRKVVDYGL